MKGSGFRHHNQALCGASSNRVKYEVHYIMGEGFLPKKKSLTCIYPFKPNFQCVGYKQVNYLCVRYKQTIRPLHPKQCDTFGKSIDLFSSKSQCQQGKKENYYRIPLIQVLRIVTIVETEWQLPGAAGRGVGPYCSVCTERQFCEMKRGPRVNGGDDSTAL